MTQTAPAATGLRLLIPRVFHQIWLGGPMPEKEQRFAESWTRHHPGWERRLWHDGNLPELRNQALFDIAPTLAQKADILRFELLLDHGGVYVDGDFECLRNIEPLLDGVRAFCGREDAMRVSNALIGCVPGHPLLDAVVAALPDAVGWLPDRGPNEQTGPDLLTRIVLEQESIGAETATVFGPEVFYPYHWSELHRADEEFPEAFAAHRWSGRMWYAKDGIQSESSEPARQEESVAQGTRLIVDVDPDLVEPGAVVLSAALAVVSAFKGELALVVPGVDEITDSIGGALSGVINQVSPLPDLPDTVVYGESEGRTLSGALRVALSADPAQNARTVLDLARLAPDAALAATAPAAATAPVAAPPAAAPPGPAAVYVGNGRLLVRTAWGDKLYCDAADLSITPDLALNGTFDEPLCAFVRRWLQPGDTAVDVGANIGVLTLLMARAVGRQGRVVAYEASPHTAALLRDNVAVNYRNDWVQVREQAAWSEQTRLTFHVSERFQGNGSLLGHDEWYQGHFRVDEHRQIEVEAVALGPVLADLRPKLVKIDVEGAEPDVLAGMADWLDSARGVAIAVEVVKHRMGDRWRLFAAQMQGLVDDGWGLALLQPDGTPVAVDPATVLRVGWFDNVLFLR